MIKNIFFTPVFLFVSYSLSAQTEASLDNKLVMLNQQIDNFVIEKNTKGLDTLYADDFIFTHGTGRIDTKPSWLKSVGGSNSRFLLRRHDSVTIEKHNEFILLKGRMDIERKDQNNLARYYLRYIRVYALRNNRWQLASHTTTHETHLQ